MGKIYTVGETELDYDSIKTYPSSDSDIHDWITRNIQSKDIDKLIISLPSESDKAKAAFRVAYHIRLMLSTLGLSKTFMPIFYLSEKNIENYLKSCSPWSQILSTQGIYYGSLAKTKKEVNYITGLGTGVHDYKQSFLRLITVKPGEKLGRHSIANQWGAMRMDEASGANAFNEEGSLQDIRKGLYFKYIKAQNLGLSYAYDKQRPERPYRPDPICSKNKKILLIDDEADKGWSKVLSSIFRSSDNSHSFEVINERVENYDQLSNEDKNNIEDGDIDLYLIDLRLNGAKEEDKTQTQTFSGAKVLKKVKSINKGNQVIMFTASNKAWNMKELTEMGSDGYYIKEGPDNGFTISESNQNYKTLKNSINDCFKVSFLRNIYVDHQKMIEFIEKDKPKRHHFYKQFYDRTLTNLELAFTLLEKVKEDEKYFNFSFLTYYQILEDYSSQRQNFRYDNGTKDCFVDKLDGNEIKVIDGKTGEWKLKYISGSKFSYFTDGIEQNQNNRSTLSKMSFIFYYKFDKDDSFLKDWGQLNELRNTVSVHRGWKAGDRNITREEILEMHEFVKLILTNT